MDRVTLQYGFASQFLDRGGIPFVPASQLYSQETAREIDCAVRALVDRAYHAALEVLEGHRDELQATAERLLVEETLSADALPAIKPTTSDRAEARKPMAMEML